MVGRSIMSFMIMIPAKTAELTEMPFGLCTWVGPRSQLLDLALPMGRGSYEGEGVALCKA